MRPLVFATRNAGKVVELRALLAAAGVTREVLSIAEAEARLGITVPEVDEDQDTFVGNATKKAREVSLATGCPALADDSGLRIRVSHFPPGTSKWNKIEHRLFCHITQNWRGKPLVSHQAIINLIASTTTRAGLVVKAAIDNTEYPTKTKVSDAELAALRLKRETFHGEWNYAITPRH